MFKKENKKNGILFLLERLTELGNEKKYQASQPQIQVQ
jgi:hypothetical protein